MSDTPLTADPRDEQLRRLQRDILTRRQDSSMRGIQDLLRRVQEHRQEQSPQSFSPSAG